MSEGGRRINLHMNYIHKQPVEVGCIIYIKLCIEKRRGIFPRVYIRGQRGENKLAQPYQPLDLALPALSEAKQAAPLYKERG